MNNFQVIRGEIEPAGNLFEIFIKPVHDKMLLTWTITLLKHSGLF